MDLFGEALRITGMSIIMVFGVLILLMLAMQFSAVIFDRAGQATPGEGKASSAVAQQPQPSIQSDETDEERVAVILAVLEAAKIDVPAGGRVRIEKVSRRS